MRMLVGLLIAAAIAGCARDVCRPVTVVKQVTVEKTEFRKINVVPTSAPRGRLLMKTAVSTEPQQNQIASHGSVSDVQRLIALRFEVHQAFLPINTPGHVATDTEIRKALAAYSDLQAFLSAHRKKK